jgi:DNA mismatch endonuclease (patch repair protein)
VIVTDRLTPKMRSWNMSRIKGKNTKPEVVVRSLLHRMGFRFRLHVRHLPGRPDVVLTRWNLVVFVHGCFWHRHPKCRFAYTPKSRKTFWLSKLEGNVSRDKRAIAALKRLGWKTLVVWECELHDLERVSARLKRKILTV